MSRPMSYPFRLLLAAGALASLSMACEQEIEQPVKASDSTSVSAQDSVRVFWQRYREATRFRQAGDFESAAAAYQAALAQDNGHLDALYYLGNVSLELGRWDRARDAWTRLVDADPGSIRGLAQLGNLSLCRPEIAAFNPAAAEDAFERANTLNPGETGPVLRLAEIALMNDRLDRAAGLLGDVLGSDRANLEALYLNAYLAWREGRFDEGLRELNQVLAGIGFEPTGPIAGEGDTQSTGGGGPAYAAGAECPLVDTFVDDFRSVPVPVERTAAEPRFRKFRTQIEAHSTAGS